MDKIVESFSKSLFDESIGNLCLEITEIGIDSIIDDNIFKDIPIASLLIGLGKTAQNIHDRNLLRQTLKFINTFNSHEISSEKLEQHKKKLNNNPSFAEEELGRIIILLNSTVETKKSELLAKFYRAYIDELINWDFFCEFSDIVSRLFITDLNLLYAINMQEVTNTTSCKIYQVDRLISLGLLNTSPKSIKVFQNSIGHADRYISTNSIGKLFCDITFTQ